MTPLQVKVRIISVQKRNYNDLHYLKIIKGRFMMICSRHKMVSKSVKNKCVVTNFSIFHITVYIIMYLSIAVSVATQYEKLFLINILSKLSKN